MIVAGKVRKSKASTKLAAEENGSRQPGFYGGPHIFKYPGLNVSVEIGGDCNREYPVKI